MFNEDKKNEGMSNPHNFMMTLSIDTALKFQVKLRELKEKYKANGVDVIPISEIDKIQGECIMESLSPEGLLAQLTKGEK